MSMLTIYTPQNGDFLKLALDGVVALTGTPTFKTAMDCMLVFACLVSAYQFITGDKIKAMSRYVLTTFFTLYCLFGISFSVNIVDMQQPLDGLTVDNVPLGVALPASIISKMGRALTLATGDAMHMPDDMDYNKTGMIFGSRTWLSSTNANFAMSPATSSDLSTFIRQCIFSSKLLASRKISADEIINSTNLKTLILKEPSNVFRVIFQDGSNLSCKEAALNLSPRIGESANLELTRLSKIMASGDKNKYKDSLEAAHLYFKGVSQGAAEIMTQNMLINAVRNAASDAFAFAGADAALMNYTNTSSIQKMHIAEANSFWLASFRLPYYMTVFWVLLICMFPLILLLSLLPLPQNVYKLYLQSLMYIWLWPPMFTVIHFLVSMGTSAQTTIFNEKIGGGATFSNIDAIANIHTNWAYVAGALAASVPFLAMIATKGLSALLSTTAQHFGGMVQSMSTSEAQAAAQGNISMANYSGWNMNYDNTNAHKFDTNRSYAAGKVTAQFDNGSQISRMENGMTVSNAQPAMSSGAVSVHGSERASESLHQSAMDSFNRSSQHRTQADNHLQQALNGVEQFVSNQANDNRSGEGVSVNTQDSYSNDLRKMEDAIKQYNKHQDASSHVSLDAAVTGKISSGESWGGKIFKGVTGASVEASASSRIGGSINNNVQKFLNSSEGQSFSDAYSHMVTTASNNHLDATDTSSLSGSSQVAANLLQSSNLTKLSSEEYTKGLQLQETASKVREHASSIDNNLAQPFHDWTVNRYGKEGERVLLGTDSRSIQTQNQWANEFLQSDTGINAVKQEVSNILKTSPFDLKNNFNHASTQMASAKEGNILNSFSADQKMITKHGENVGLKPMSNKQQQQADSLRSHNQSTELSKQLHNNKKEVASEIRDGKFIINNESQIRKSAFNDHNKGEK